jgi:hypothetical protein
VEDYGYRATHLVRQRERGYRPAVADPTNLGDRAPVDKVDVASLFPPPHE